MSNKYDFQYELETYLAVLINCPVLVLASAISGGIFFLNEEELGPGCLVTACFLNGAFDHKISFFSRT